MQTEVQCIMTLESICTYIQHEQDQGASEDTLRRCRQFASSLYRWLPEDKEITKERLLDWRQGLKDLGYSYCTEQNYAKGINRYLNYRERPDLCFPRGKAKNIAGQRFGYLTVLERTEKKERKDYIWRCRCQCGKEVEFPATRLLTGNTLSCGCLRGERLKQVNKYFAGTSLRQSIEERVFSEHAESGYTGVRKKRGKWMAYIRYKGKNHFLGCYSQLEEAVKARARGKELVRQDALGLLVFYEAQQKDVSVLSDQQESGVKKVGTEEKKAPQKVLRSNNTSGCPGVYQKRDKWAARITYQKVNYSLGTFSDIDLAVQARKEAESLLNLSPERFCEKYGNKRGNS